MNKFEVRVSKERIAAYRIAAAKKNMTLSEWFRQVGDSQLPQKVLKQLPVERKNIRKKLR